MRTLNEIATRFGTDKSGQGHNYCMYYSMFFESFRNNKINICEWGVDEGNSLLTWADYFPNAEVHGVDIRGDYEYLNERGIITHIADQSKKGDLILFAEQYPNYFDIIIDDCSHMSDDIILTFETLFPYLKSGGFYCSEDLLCDQDDRWNKGTSSVERFKQVITEINMSGSIPNSHLCANKQEAVKKYPGSYFDLNIEWLFASCGLVIIKKM